MPFTTLAYVAFFVIVFFAYYALPKKYQWLLLLIASYVFYSYVSAYYLIFLAITTFITYAGAMAIDNNLRRQATWLEEFGRTVSRDEKKAYKESMDRRRQLALTFVIIAVLLLLGIFKYLEFFLQNIAAIAGLFGFEYKSPALDIILPIGLSFYIFQSLGYCIDVQREMVVAERNVFKHALFVSFFPQLLQGPIGNYSRLSPQLFVRHEFDYIQVKFGLQRVAWGLFKKLVIANTIAHKIDPVWSSVDSYSGLGCWSAILFAYAIQLYADFSGYMDIACGCGQMLGIRLDENFNCPYFAKSVADFWRRWHMTLGEWFKNYLFYPLLRSRLSTKVRKSLKNKYLSSTVPTIISLSIVWFVIGLWHGANWAYVIYGVYYGFFMVLAVVFDAIYKRIHDFSPMIFESVAYSIFRMLRTFIIVVFGYAIFKPASISMTIQIYGSMCDFHNIGLSSCGIFAKDVWPMWVGVIGMFVADVIHYRFGEGTIRSWFACRNSFVRYCIYIAGLLYVINFGLFGDEFNHFEYFKF